jgi:hypothetical protein
MPEAPATTIKTGNECGTSHCFAGWCDILSGRLDLMKTALLKDDEELTAGELFNALSYGINRVTYTSESPAVLDLPTEFAATKWLGRPDEEISHEYNLDDVSAIGDLDVTLYDLYYRTNNKIRDVEEWYYRYVDGLLLDSIKKMENGATTTKDRRLRIKARWLQNKAEYKWFYEDDENVFSVDGPRLDIPYKYYDSDDLKKVFSKYSDDEVKELIHHTDNVVKAVAHKERDRRFLSGEKQKAEANNDD